MIDLILFLDYSQNVAMQTNFSAKLGHTFIWHSSIPKLNAIFNGNILSCILCKFDKDQSSEITISPVLSKLFEHCILDRFGSFLNTSDNQFGFKKGLECSFAIHAARNITDGFIKGV